MSFIAMSCPCSSAPASDSLRRPALSTSSSRGSAYKKSGRGSASDSASESKLVVLRAQRAVNVVQMLFTVDRARQVERGASFCPDLRQHRVAQRLHLPVGLLGEPKRKLRRIARREGQTERLGRSVHR